MQVLAGGSIHPKEAIEYICKLPNIESILFGASSKTNIESTASYIHQFDKQEDNNKILSFAS
jgi:predicted aldo/keto reductase-like oxidoreductase